MEKWGSLIGVGVGAIIVLITDFVKAKFSKSRNKKYLAIRLIPILEKFLNSCYQVASDTGEYQGEPAGNDRSYIPQVMTPKLILPSDVDWTCVDKQLLRKIIFLPRELETINQYLAFESDIISCYPYDDYMFTRRYEFSKLSLKCDLTLQKLKKIISLPSDERQRYDSYRKDCEKFIKQAERHLKEQEIYQSKQ